MLDHITNLERQGYSVIQMNQNVCGTAYQKLDSKIMSLYDRGFRRIAVVTNSDNPYLTRISEIAARATRNLRDSTVIVSPIFEQPVVQQPVVQQPAIQLSAVAKAVLPNA